MRTYVREDATATSAKTRADTGVASRRSMEGPENTIILPILPSDHFLGIEVEHQRFPRIVLLRRQSQRAATRVQYRAPRALGRGAVEGIRCHSRPILNISSAHGAIRIHFAAELDGQVLCFAGERKSTRVKYSH